MNISRRSSLLILLATVWTCSSCIKVTNPAQCHEDPPAVGSGNSHFFALHADLRNSDEVDQVLPSKYKHSWHSEDKLFIPEGPIIDKRGNLYISPLLPHEPVRLLSLNSLDGTRRWSIAHEGASSMNGGGPPLVLERFAGAETTVIVHTQYDNMLAVDSSGRELWRKQTGLHPVPGQNSLDTHVFGTSYLPQLGLFVALTGDGAVLFHDEGTGQSLLRYTLPGAPAAQLTDRPDFPGWLLKRTNNVLSESGLMTGATPFTGLYNALLGGGSKVSNFFASDITTHRLYIGATAPDDADGKKDGISELGAIYALQVTRTGDLVEVQISCRSDFAGGTAASPALSPQGTTVYTADGFGKLVAIRATDCKRLWSIDVGEQIFASISISSNGGELFGSTRSSIVQVFDKGTTAVIGWRSDLTTVLKTRGPFIQTFNLLTAAITGNYIVAQVGAGPVLMDGRLPIPLKLGVALIDRSNGKAIRFIEGGEESVAVTIIGPDQALYTAASPVRRLIGKALLGPLLSDLKGGISRFVPAPPQIR